MFCVCKQVHSEVPALLLLTELLEHSGVALWTGSGGRVSGRQLQRAQRDQTTEQEGYAHLLWQRDRA